ncbi:MAG: phage terminase large subunit [Nitrospinales bacterium]
MMNKRIPFEWARKRLLPYAISQWADYAPAEHHRLIANHLENVELGEILRLMIFMPPRHGKTMLASEYFSAWYMGRNAQKEIIAITYSQERANDIGRKVRNQITDSLHGEIFKECSLSPDSTSMHRFNTVQGGSYFGVGIGGPITGRGAHLLLIDDPVKNREEAESETKRRSIKDWYVSTAYPRLMPGGAIILIQTRWHEDDLAGWLLKEHAHENWTVINLSAIAETHDGIGREPGQALWEECYPKTRLEEIKRTIGSRDWSALYQQRPAPQEGSIIKYEWFMRYKTPPAYFERKALSLDTAYKAREINDPSVCTVWGETDKAFYLLDVWRARVEYPTLKSHVLSLAEEWKPDAVLIEDKASGQSLIQDLTNHTRLPIIPVSPQGDKVIRTNAVSSLFEARRVYLPESASWLIDYETELITFPNAAHDDQVDSTTQYLAWAKEHSVEPLILSSGRRVFGNVKTSEYY